MSNLHQKVRKFQDSIYDHFLFSGRPLFKNFYYAFVMFDTIENAKRAMEEHRFPMIKGDRMSRADTHPGLWLYLTTCTLSEESQVAKISKPPPFSSRASRKSSQVVTSRSHVDLYAKFCSYGKILSCKVSINPDHEFLGFGYIQFSKIEEAQKAIKEVSKSKYFDVNSFFTVG